MTEVEVRTDHYELRPERSDENISYEVFSRLGRPLLVEPDHHGAIDRLGGEQLELLFEICELVRR